jgi:hypothetical protein
MSQPARPRNGARSSGARFRGYGVLGLPFTLGDVLAFRRFDSSSVGPVYNAVWHRDPHGLWTIYTDVPPMHGCARYFAVGRTRARRTEILLEWTDRDRAAISIPEHQLDWAIRLGQSARSRALNGATGLIPGRLLSSRPLLDVLAPVTARLLSAGPLRYTGATPAGQQFRLVPFHTSLVTASAAVVGGRDLGPIGPLEHPAHLGDLAMPDRGLFVRGEWRIEP